MSKGRVVGKNGEGMLGGHSLLQGSSELKLGREVEGVPWRALHVWEMSWYLNQQTVRILGGF